MKKSDLKELIREEIQNVLSETVNIVDKIEDLLSDETLIDPRVNDFNFNLEYYPLSYKGDQAITIVINHEHSPTSSTKNIYDVSIDNFIKFLNQQNLIKDETRFRKELQNILK